MISLILLGMILDKLNMLNGLVLILYVICIIAWIFEFICKLIKFGMKIRGDKENE